MYSETTTITSAYPGDYDSYLHHLKSLDTPEDSIRVMDYVARNWLYHNMSVIRSGVVRYLSMRHIGLGVYTVMLAPYKTVSTMLYAEDTLNS